MFFGYNTNGFAFHRLEDAIEGLAEIGYRGIGITLNHAALSPLSESLRQECEGVRALLQEHNLRAVIETGAPFLLHRRHKHTPSLLDPDCGRRQCRVELIHMAMHIAGLLGADAVSFASGVLPGGTSPAAAMDLLVDECRRLTRQAEQCQVRLAFEPEPEALIATMAQFAELHDRVNHPLFGLTLDVGHAHCLGDGSIPAHIEAWSAKLFNVHIEDMKQGVHDHLFFGAGEIDFPPILAALKQTGYPYGVYVELARHSNDAVNVAKAAHEFLNRATQEAG